MAGARSAPRLRRAAWAAALVASCALLAAPGAAAHAYLVRSVPAAGSVTSASPTRLVLTFDEPVSPAGIQVAREDGGSVTQGAAFVPRGRPNDIVVPLRHGLTRGGYLVRWREVDEDDGHVISGSFSFAVGAGVHPRAVAVAHGSDFRAGDALGRWLLLTGLLLGAGLVAFRRLIWRPALRAGQIDPGMEGPGRQGLTSALAAALLVAAAGATVVVGRQPDWVATRFAKLTLVGGLLAGAAALMALASRRRPRLEPVAEATAVLLLVLPTVNGHAFAGGPSHLLSVPSDLVHLAAASVWTGGVLFLAVLAPIAVRSLPSPDRRPALAVLTRRFARLAALAVGGLAVTGALRALGELHSVSQLWSTSYGEAILVKTALFGGLVGIAALVRGRPSRRMLAAELAGLAALVGAVAVLTSLRPGLDVGHSAAVARTNGSTFVVAAQADDLAVGLALTPRSDSTVTTRATVLGPSGPISGLGVHLIVSGSPVETAACGPGCYEAVTGRPASLGIRLERPGKKPAFARFRVPASWPPRSATSIVRRATQTFRELRTLTLVSRLASTPSNATTTIWKLQAPDRLSYRERGSGSEGVIVGTHRWDRESLRSPWVESAQTTRLHQPAPPWPPPFRSAHILGDDVVEARGVWIVSFFDPVTPSWFTIAVDKTTFRTRWVDMIATAHFMHERYRGFDAPTVVKAPLHSTVTP